PCSAFTSWRARKRDPKTLSLAAHNQELVLGHVTFVLQQLFQISLERGLCFNHRIERLLHCGRQIICIDVLPLQFFPCHCLASNVGCLDQTESFAFSAKWQSERDDFLWHHDLSISNASSRALNSSENSDVSCAVAVEILHPPCALKFEVGREGEVARLKWSKFFGHIRDSTLIVGRSSIARASRSFQRLHWLKRASTEVTAMVQ